VTAGSRRLGTARTCRITVASQLALIVILVAAPSSASAPVKRASSTIAVTANGATLVVTNPDSSSVSLIDTARLLTTAEVGVGADPRTVAVDGRNHRAWVASRGAGTVSLLDLEAAEVLAEAEVGNRPYGVVASLDGERVWVAVQGEDLLLELDGASLAPLRSLALADRPSGLAVCDRSRVLLVTHLLDGLLSVVDLDSWTTLEVPLWPDSNLAQSVVLSPDGATAFLPHTRSNAANPLLTFDTTVFPLVSLVDVPGRRHLVGQQLSLDTLDPPGVGLPFDAALGAGGTTLWVVNAASNDVTVVDLTTRRRVAHVEVGDNPRGVVLSPDGGTAYVSNSLAGTVSVVDAGSFTVRSTVQVSAIPLPPALLNGKRLFNSSDDPRLARAQWIACSSCHFDGEHDGRTWQFGFTGPRNTTSLHGMVQTYPLRWSAEWDESADSEFAITQEQFGSGLLGGTMHQPLATPNGGRSYELDCLGGFVDGLLTPENHLRGQLDPAAVARGQALFADPVIGCADCHPAPYATDFAVHDVGTADGPLERLGPEIDTPTLRDLAHSAPYLHDGSATSLAELLTSANPNDGHGVTSHLDSNQIDDLVAYLLSIPAANLARLDGHSSQHGAGKGRVPMATDTADARQPRRAEGRQPDGLPVTGRVVFAATGEPCPGALVTVRATGLSTVTALDGEFTLRVPRTSAPLEIAAWLDGHYIASVTTVVPASGVELRLRRYHTSDNPDYEWVDPHPAAASNAACGNCHPMILPQWEGNAHGGAVSNPRFFSFYNGTDVTGASSVTPGYLLDFPGTTGNCAACHAPGAAIDAPFSTDMNAVRGRLEAGIHCDFCHKVVGAFLEPLQPSRRSCTPCHKAGDQPLPSSLKTPYPNMPGVLSLKVLRPPDGEQLFVGPYPDIHDPDTYSPLMRSSEYCAPCHQFSFWGTPIYESYGEWLASPYSDPETGQTCQDCHMPPNGDHYYALPEQGGLWHPADAIPSHLDLGASSVALLQSTLALELGVAGVDGRLAVETTVTNSGAGHHAPTDHPGRHLLLVVEATGPEGNPLELLSGPTIPEWGGSLAGKPGRGYAKLLQDVASGEWPVVSYWKQALIREDTRLAALAVDRATFEFASPGGEATIRARVLFRRLFEPIAVRYGWELGEVVMEEAELRIAP
jgi:YVTN family beta-propeller protein